MITRSDLVECEQLTWLAGHQPADRLSPEALRSVFTGAIEAGHNDPDMVEFAGQEFYVRALLGIGLDRHHPEIAEFKETIERLNQFGLDAESNDKKESPAVFIAHGKSCNWFNILTRMAANTAWQVKFMTSRINPGKGLDVSIIVS